MKKNADKKKVVILDEKIFDFLKKDKINPSEDRSVSDVRCGFAGLNETKELKLLIAHPTTTIITS